MYKKKYVIGIYSNDRYELCETILENADQFAAYTGCKRSAARTILTRLFKKDYECVVVDGKKKKVEFVNVVDF